MFVFLLLTCFSCIGNGLIMVLLARTPAIRTATNIVIGSMAVADLCRCIVFSGSMIGRSLSSNYLIGQSWCHNENFVKLSFNMVIRLSIITMVTFRLASVFWPNLNLLSTKAKSLPVLIIWSASWTFMFVLTRYFWVWSVHEVRHSDRTQTVCDVSDQLGKGFWIAYVSLMLYVPLFMLLFLYSTVYLLTYWYARALQDATGRERGQQVNNKILLLYVLMAIVSEIPAQVYIIRKYMHSADLQSDVSPDRSHDRPANSSSRKTGSRGLEASSAGQSHVQMSGLLCQPCDLRIREFNFQEKPQVPLEAKL